MDFLTQTPVQLVLSILALLAMCGGAYYWVLRLRDSSKNDLELAPELLKNFEEMRHEGDISDKEFRNIESVLGKKLPETAKDANQAP